MKTAQFATNHMQTKKMYNFHIDRKSIYICKYLQIDGYLRLILFAHFV